MPNCWKILNSWHSSSKKYEMVLRKRTWTGQKESVRMSAKTIELEKKRQDKKKMMWRNIWGQILVFEQKTNYFSWFSNKFRSNSFDLRDRERVSVCIVGWVVVCKRKSWKREKKQTISYVTQSAANFLCKYKNYKTSLNSRKIAIWFWVDFLDFKNSNESRLGAGAGSILKYQWSMSSNQFKPRRGFLFRSY